MYNGRQQDKENIQRTILSFLIMTAPQQYQHDGGDRGRSEEKERVGMAQDISDHALFSVRNGHDTLRCTMQQCMGAAISNLSLL
jgi:hypothetical protein